MLRRHLTREQVVAYRDGEGTDSGVDRHLAGCAECRSRVGGARRLGHLLEHSQPAASAARSLLAASNLASASPTGMTGPAAANPHPLPETLAAYLDGGPTPDAAAIRRHLSECEECLADAACLQAVPGRLSAAPPALVARVKQRTHTGSAPRPLGRVLMEFLEGLPLRLSFQPPAAGLPQSPAPSLSRRALALQFPAAGSGERRSPPARSAPVRKAKPAPPPGQGPGSRGRSRRPPESPGPKDRRAESRGRQSPDRAPALYDVDLSAPIAAAAPAPFIYASVIQNPSPELEIMVESMRLTVSGVLQDEGTVLEIGVFAAGSGEPLAGVPFDLLNSMEAPAAPGAPRSAAVSPAPAAPVSRAAAAPVSRSEVMAPAARIVGQSDAGGRITLPLRSGDYRIVLYLPDPWELELKKVTG